MISDLLNHQDYLEERLHPNRNQYLWKWVENGNVLVWYDDTTIAFRHELVHVLTHLAPRGLPPFGSLLLLLGATRNTAPEGVWRLFNSAEVSRQRDNAARAKAAQVAAGLHRIRGLPEELRVPTFAKAYLAELVFENSLMRTPPEVAEQVIQRLTGGHIEDTPVLMTGASSPPVEGERLQRDMECLLSGLGRIDAETLRLRLQTGLEETPKPAEVEVPTGEGIRGLLRRLEDDTELGGLARLARVLMAAMSLPRAVSEPDELPQGGYSDLTNRGPLDRLLLSELAHDDLTLAVRVSTGAALYRRREKPPQPRPRVRSVLLETGLRSWGVPRVFATAAALATAATADKHTSFVCHRASGAALQPVDLLTREGLTAHLAALETEVHPGKALPEFARVLAEGKLDTDAFLIVGEDVYADRDFQRALAGLGDAPLLLATVNRSGAFVLLSRSKRGVRVIRQAKIDLETLFRPPAPKVKPKPLVTEGAGDRPAIFRVHPFPLRLTHPVDPTRMARVDGAGVLAVTRDRRMMLWSRKGCGALQMAENLPSGHLLWSAPEPVNNRLVVVVGQPGQPTALVTAHLATREVVSRAIPLSDPSYRGVACHGGMLFVIHRRTVEGFDLETLERRGSVNLPPHTYRVRDRFFRGGRPWRWSALCNKEGKPAFVDVPLIHEALGATLLTMMDCPAVDGPFGITVTGSGYVQPTMELRTYQQGLKTPVEVEAVSSRGERVILRGKAGPHDFLRLKVVDIRTGQVDEVHGNAVAEVERFSEYVSPVTLRSLFHSILVDNTHRICLKSRRGQLVDLIFSTDTNTIRLAATVTGPMPTVDRPFHPVPREAKRGYRIRKAEWPEGSRAFIDSRGLLHLQSHDRSIPEVTLVLSDGSLAGWCADGTLFGPSYFTGESSDSAATLQVWENAIMPFARRLT